ncbi:MAG TPA: NAD-dependent epimerase/dehydratase family protein [Legionellaceae bacterium]|nr:NAD-dependent epimerase/dehydratase family protein [Legionellaceae bacterium]
MMFSLPSQDLEHIWQKGKNCLQALDGARIFITGGTGFFGTWLLESLAFAKTHDALDAEIVVLSRNPEHFLKKMPHMRSIQNLKWLQGEVHDFHFPDGSFTHVIHAATSASADLNQNHPLMMLDTIVYGTRRVLDFAAQADVKKFLLTSSGAIYGIQPPTLSHIDETYIGTADPLSAHSAYAGGKWMAEHLAIRYAEHFNMDVTIARCFAFVGPYLPLDAHFAIGNFLWNVMQGQPIYLHGDGTPYRSYLYAADLMVWLWHILCFGQSKRVYNVGSEEEIALSALAEKIAQYACPNVPVIISKTPDPTLLPARYVPSTQRAQQELNLIQWISLEDSIRRTLDWNVSYAKAKTQ